MMTLKQRNQHSRISDLFGCFKADYLHFAVLFLYPYDNKRHSRSAPPLPDNIV